MVTEEITRLTGSLNFQVNANPLIVFEQMLKRVQQQMVALGKEADSLQSKLSKKLGISTKGLERTKLDGDIRKSLDKELITEVKLAKVKQANFAAELAGAKLQYAHQKETSALTNASIKERQQLAVLAAREAKAEAERAKALGVSVRNEASIVTSKLRQQRLESVLQGQQQKTVLLQQKQYMNMTAMQKAEVLLQQTRERGMRATEKYTQAQAATKQRIQRTELKHQQQTERFEGWKARQSVWAANQNKPKEQPTGMGLGFGIGLGAAGMGVAAVVAAINALANRLDKTQTRVGESQQFSNVLEQSAGKNPANQKFAKDEFLRISEQFGTSVDIDSAKEYRTFLLHQMATGKSISDATKMYETQMSAFRGAGMSKTEMQRANIQLTQVRAKGKGDTEDVNTFSEAAPLLIDPIKQAWAERNKYKGKNLEKDFRASFKMGNLKAVDFERGLEIFNRDNQPAIQKQSASIDANATRLESKKFLQQQGLDSNAELISSVNERIQAESELTDAMKPLKEATTQLDIAFMQMASKFLRFTMGKDESPASAGKKVDSLTPDMPAIDPSAFGGKGSVIPAEKLADPVDSFYRWLTNTPDYSKEGPATQLRAPNLNLLGVQYDGLDFSKFQPKSPEPSELDDSFHRFRPNPFITAQDLMRGPEDAMPKYPATPSITTTNNVTNVTPGPTTVTNSFTINVPDGTDAERFGRIVGEQVREQLQKELSYTSKEVK